VGDATTSSVALAQSILKEALRFLPTETSFGSKKSPVEVKNIINKEKDDVIEKLSKLVKNIESEEELINSARVSVEDEELAQLIGKAQWELGPDGMIIAEETPELESSIQKIKGVRIDNGFGTSVIMNNLEKQTLEADNCSIILTNHILDNFKGLEPVINQLINANRKDIVIVARAFSSEAIKLCLDNIKNGLRIYPINAPFTNQGEMMRDLAAVTGTRYIDTEEALLEDLNITDIGMVSKIIARRYDAIIAGLDNKETIERVEARVNRLKEELKGEVSEFAKKALESRISQLTNGFAILKVGATSDIDRKYKKDKADDAVNAVRLALKGGTVKGAGLAFKDIAEEMPDTSLLKRPLQVINQLIMQSAPEGFIVEEWVRDPFLVLKAALTNACSVAGTFATTGIIITSENPKQTCHAESRSEGE
jgi:chaperonin GroEL